MTIEVFRGTAALTRRLSRPVLTIGNFDGIHVGHRSIMETVVRRARSLGGESVVYTFEPHPRKVLQPDRAPGLLTSLSQKLELLEALGADCAIVEPFDLEFARTPPEKFIHERVHQAIGPLEVYVGYDFQFGRDREGSMRMLAETGPHLGFSVTIIPEVTVGGRDVNSTRIRELLGEGQVEESAELLGRYFSVRARVAKGEQRGRTIGFPTANLLPENEVLPAPGVYGGFLRLLDSPSADQVPAVTNVGYRPTFKDGRGLVAEAHLIDFDADIYGQEVELDFRFRIRAEERFPGIDELRARIARDVAEAARRLEGS